ncbi:MAG: hypothetical protein R3E12_17905 [Candidatus Eisenbacteria bacterium]
MSEAVGVVTDRVFPRSLRVTSREQAEVAWGLPSVRPGIDPGPETM